MAADGREWFTWSYYHPSEAQDPRAAFAAGLKAGRRQMLDDSGQWVRLVPLLASLLEELVSLREERAIEREVVASDIRPAF